MKPLSVVALAVAAAAQETVPVTSHRVERSVKLPGEFAPYQSVDLHARVTGFVETVDVDRGSAVTKGQRLITLVAPELVAQRAEAEARVLTLRSQRIETEARLVGAESTAARLRTASETPGAVAGNEIILADKTVDAIKASIASLDSSIKAAQAAVTAIGEMQKYLEIVAPFDGVVTERIVHPGALAGPQQRSLLRVEQVARLRLVVAVPEGDVGAVPIGSKVTFAVPAFPGETFSGTIARPSRTLDPKTRTMPVEVDVVNASGKLAPGMYPEVSWPVRRSQPSLLVPPTAVVTTTERIFVVKAEGGKARWVTVRKGSLAGEFVEIFGDLRPGDRVVKKATDEIRDGSTLSGK